MIYEVWIGFRGFPWSPRPAGPFPLVLGPSIFPCSSFGPEYMINNISEMAITSNSCSLQSLMCTLKSVQDTSERVLESF